MVDLEFSPLSRAASLGLIGDWLEQNMPNPPLPEEQRWTIGYSVDGRVGIRFSNDEDATIFALRWS